MEAQMLKRLLQRGSGRTLGVVAVVVAAVGFVGSSAAGVNGPSGHTTAAHARASHSDKAFRGIIRVERDFVVSPHSLATNEILRCPARTMLTGGGTSLIGEPLRPANAPVLYTNGPVGDILPGEQQSWGSEVANRSGETFTYRQFALCARHR
jgi:hypothetical protein